MEMKSILDIFPHVKGIFQFNSAISELSILSTLRLITPRTPKQRGERDFFVTFLNALWILYWMFSIHIPWILHSGIPAMSSCLLNRPMTPRSVPFCIAYFRPFLFLSQVPSLSHGAFIARAITLPILPSFLP